MPGRTTGPTPGCRAVRRRVPGLCHPERRRGPAPCGVLAGARSGRAANTPTGWPGPPPRSGRCSPVAIPAGDRTAIPVGPAAPSGPPAARRQSHARSTGRRPPGLLPAASPPRHARSRHALRATTADSGGSAIPPARATNMPDRSCASATQPGGRSSPASTASRRLGGNTTHTAPSCPGAPASARTGTEMATNACPVWRFGVRPDTRTSPDFIASAFGARARSLGSGPIRTAPSRSVSPTVTPVRSGSIRRVASPMPAIRVVRSGWVAATAAGRCATASICSNASPTACAAPRVRSSNCVAPGARALDQPGAERGEAEAGCDQSGNDETGNHRVGRDLGEEAGPAGQGGVQWAGLPAGRPPVGAFRTAVRRARAVLPRAGPGVQRAGCEGGEVVDIRGHGPRLVAAVRSGLRAEYGRGHSRTGARRRLPSSERARIGAVDCDSHQSVQSGGYQSNPSDHVKFFGRNIAVY